jgi:Flp pilus assembly protein CpaB
VRLRSGNGSLWFVALGLIAAVAAAWWTWSAQQAANRTEAVVVATEDVPPLATVAPGAVQLQLVPVQAVPDGAIREVSAVVGHYVRFGLLHGQVVQTASLASTAGGNPADAQITAAADGSADVRAVTVALQAETGLDLPVPGDHVDVLAVVRGQGTPQARVVASGVLVLDRIGASPTTGGLSAPGASQPSAQSGALVLALTVAQAEQVALAQTMGQVQVLLDPLGAKVSAPPPLLAGQWFAAGGK